MATGADDRTWDRGPIARRTPIIGRAREIEAVVGAVGRGHRLVTITGAGGIGKTRVALEAAAKLRECGSTIHLVALEGLDGEDARRAVVEAVVAGEDGGAPAVLLLDAVEHVRGRSDDLEAVVRSTGPALIVTSRVRLHLDGEHVVTIGPLPTADAGALLRRCALAAGAADSDLSPELVTGVCEEVGHHPLAIELAAARAASVGLGLVAEHLASGEPGAYLSTLGGGGSGAEVRDLAGAIERTTQLLSDPAARLLRRLGVVSGSFGPDVVAALCDDPANGPRLVAELAELHLVERVEEAEIAGGALGTATTPTGRLRLQRAVAEHCRDALSARGEEAAARAAHLAYALTFAEAVGRGIRADEGRWHRRARRERSTLHALLDHLAAEDPAAGLDIAVALAPHWLQAGPIDQGRRWLGTFLSRSDGKARPHVAAARAWSAALAVEVGEHDHLGAQERAVAELRGALATPDLLVHLDLLAQSRLLTGDLDGAAALAEECLALATDIGSGVDVAKTLNRRANIARQADRPREAAELALQLLERADAHDRPAWAAWAHAVLADLKARARPDEAAVAALRESRDRSLDAGLLRPALWTAISTGAFLSLGPDVEASCRELRAGLRLATDIGHHSAAVCAAMGIAALGSRVGRHESAAIVHRGLEHHLEPLEGGVLPPRLLVPYVRSRARSYAVADPGPDSGLRPWSEILLLTADLAEAVVVSARSSDSGSDPRPADTDDVRARPPDVLSAREVEVLAALAEGGTNREIALRLYISPKTVMHHTSAIYRKLGVTGRTEAVARAYRDGMLPVD